MSEARVIEFFLPPWQPTIGLHEGDPKEPSERNHASAVCVLAVLRPVLPRSHDHDLLQLPRLAGQDRWPESASLHIICMSALSWIDVTRWLGHIGFQLSNNWELDNGRVSAHTSGYIRAAGYMLLNP